ncbi:hypothetical protein AB0L75_03320 [Streptomyces sp. NPDC052101]|uniref:hypothetical protein n=1 Tax=Streptomyces sp. NPDC052101 TaxID=3155763 RepID=UPI0034337A4B
MYEELGSAGRRTCSDGQSKGLLEQMEELMAALNADLSELADLQGAAGGAEESGTS